MKKRKLMVQVLAMLLCAALLCPLTAFAEGEKTNGNETPASAIPSDPQSYAVIDPTELKNLVDNYAANHKLDRSKISVGYCYLDTGDTWFFNGDTWYYSANTYFVPLMMILAEWESQGKSTRDTSLKDLKLGDAERYILIYNSNIYAHSMMSVVGSDKKVREEYQRFAGLSEEYYVDDYYEYSYFTARFLTEVIKTLYLENERFPNILETMKGSDNGQYFHGGLKGQIEVAQKSGYFTDRRGVEFNHDTGVIYTEHPFVLTVMTQDMGTGDKYIFKDLAVQFKDYTESLNEAYAAWEKDGGQAAPAPAETPAEPDTESAAAETPAEPGTESAAAETPAEPGTESAAAETPAETGTESEVPTAEEAANAVPATPAPAEPGSNQGTKPVPSDSSVNGRVVAMMICLAALVILVLGLVVRGLLRRKNRADEDEYLW